VSAALGALEDQTMIPSLLLLGPSSTSLVSTPKVRDIGSQHRSYPFLIALIYLIIGVEHHIPRVSTYLQGRHRTCSMGLYTPVLNNSADVAGTWARSRVAGQLAAE